MHLRRANVLCLVTVVGALLNGCSATVVAPNGSDDASGSDAAVVDTESGLSDMPHGTAPLFARCSTDSDCLATPGVTCLSDFAGGVCSRRCTMDSDCGPQGDCINNICLVSCGQGVDECAAIQGACEYSISQDDASVQICVASCTPTDLLAPGAPGCGTGLTCDAYSGSCEAPPLPTGLANGAACTDDTLCLGGQCFLGTDFQGDPTGFIGGYCLSYARQPPASAFVPGGPMPRSNCPSGSVVFPYMGLNTGEYVPCYLGCAVDTDCRAGYFCDDGADIGAQTYGTGACLPFDCTQPGRTCPPGTVCGTANSSFLGHPVCGPPMTGM